MIDLDIQIDSNSFIIKEQSPKIYSLFKQPKSWKDLCFISAKNPELSYNCVYLRGFDKGLDDIIVSFRDSNASSEQLKIAFIDLAQEYHFILRLNGVIYGGRRQL